MSTLEMLRNLPLGSGAMAAKNTLDSVAQIKSLYDKFTPEEDRKNKKKHFVVDSPAIATFIYEYISKRLTEDIKCGNYGYVKMVKGVILEKKGRETIYKPTFEEHLFVIGYRPKVEITFEPKRESQNKSKTHALESIEFTVKEENFGVLFRWVKKFEDDHEKSLSKKIQVHEYSNSLKRWFLSKPEDPVKLSSIVLKKNKRSKIHSILEAVRETMKIKDHPRIKEGFAFYGEPGNGKSSLIAAFATELEGWIICNLDLKQIGNEENLKNAMKNLPKYSLVVMEDFDANLVRGESRQFIGSNSVGFSSVLNVMDGIIKPNSSCIFIITTNHFDQLDDALKRDGRAEGIELENPRLEEMKEMYSLVVGEKCKPEFDKLFRACEVHNFPMSTYSSIFKEMKKRKLRDDECSYFSKKIEERLESKFLVYVKEDSRFIFDKRANRVVEKSGKSNSYHLMISKAESVSRIALERKIGEMRFMKDAKSEGFVIKRMNVKVDDIQVGGHFDLTTTVTVFLEDDGYCKRYVKKGKTICVQLEQEEEEETEGKEVSDEEEEEEVKVHRTLFAGKVIAAKKPKVMIKNEEAVKEENQLLKENMSRMMEEFREFRSKHQNVEQNKVEKKERAGQMKEVMFWIFILYLAVVPLLVLIRYLF